ncbi:hypothetical protein GGR57DRAFT_103391 [Xylariaceae sp. FL1272]|nr:hypothetical protein GGR57DRAFT_103391 [Xylariaceae sp. FL1272]
MSTQTDTGVPVSHALDGVAYKLLELPPELLEALESDQPPDLILESASPAAVLKHGSKSWNLRQKNTSNAIILLKPVQSTEPADSLPQTSLAIVSTLHDTIELVAESTAPTANTAKGKWHEKFARAR